MKTKQDTFIAALACLLIISVSAQAHHGSTAYDMTKIKSLKGTVTEFSLANPHSHISFDLKNPSGIVEHWVVESVPSLTGMKAGGFDFHTLKPGDVITINLHPGKDGAKIGAMINVELPDGRVLPHEPRIDTPSN